MREAQVTATIDLFDGGSTVPFVARYRKEATGGLDDTQLRTLDERLKYLREMEDRRTAILKSIDEQGKLTPQVREQIEAAESKARLEDLYLPFKPNTAYVNTISPGQEQESPGDRSIERRIEARRSRA